MSLNAHFCNIPSADRYHLLNNNCNHFTDHVCQFLVSKGIPSHITSLPAEFLNTPLGQSLRPMIDSMFAGPNVAHNQPVTRVAPTSSIQPQKAVDHPHGEVKLGIDLVATSTPITFATGNVSAIFKKLDQFIAESDFKFSGNQESYKALQSKLTQSITNSSIDASHLAVLTELLDRLPVKNTFPVMDLFRLVALNKSAQKHLTKEPSTVFQLIKRFGIASHVKSADVPVATVMMTMRMLCNLLAGDMANVLMSDQKFVAPGSDMALSVPSASITINAILSHILEASDEYNAEYMKDKNVRQAVASLIFTISVFVSLQRQRLYGLKQESPHVGYIEEEEPEYVVELISALAHVLQVEIDTGVVDDDETGYRLLMALEFLIYLCPEIVTSMLSVLEVKSTIDKWSSTSDRVKRVCSDITNLMAA